MNDEENEVVSVGTLYKALTQLKTDLTSHSESLFARMTDEFLKLAGRFQKFEETNRRLAKAVEILDRFKRKNNLIIHDLDIENNISQVALLDTLREFFRSKLAVEVLSTDVNNIYLVGEHRQVIKVEFLSFIKKVEVLKNTKKLKATKIYVSNDLNESERKNQKILVEHLRLARDKQYRAYIRDGCLIVDGERFTVEQLKDSEGRKLGIRPSSAPSTPSRISSSGVGDDDEADLVSSGAVGKKRVATDTVLDERAGEVGLNRKIMKGPVESFKKALRSNSLEKKEKTLAENKASAIDQGIGSRSTSRKKGVDSKVTVSDTGGKIKGGQQDWSLISNCCLVSML